MNLEKYHFSDDYQDPLIPVAISIIILSGKYLYLR